MAHRGMRKLRLLVVLLPVLFLCALPHAMETASAADGEEAVAAYETAVRRAKAKRPRSTTPVYDKPIPGRERTLRIPDGEHVQLMKERWYETQRSLSEMVFNDNSVGKVYPGALLWTEQLPDGRLEPVQTLPGRPSVKVTTTGANLTPAADTKDLSFTHDGTLSDFTAKAESVKRKISGTETRWEVQIEYGKSIESSLLKLGLSASFWKTKLGASRRSESSTERSFAVLSLSQVYYSMVMQTPGPAGALPRSYLKEHPEVATSLAGDVPTAGEIGYIRRVSYGRRVLVSISAEASERDLRHALRFSTGGVGFKVGTSADHRARSVHTKVQARGVVIGGGLHGSVMDAITGDFGSFLRHVNRFLKSTSRFNPESPGVPVSFEVAYVSDNAPFQSYETVEFSGRIPGRRLRVAEEFQKTVTFSVSHDYAQLIRQDWEVHSDDWTWVHLRHQFSLSSDRRRVMLKLTMDVQEREGNRRYRNKTHIRTTRSWAVYEVPPQDRRPIEAVVARLNADSREQYYRGEVHGWRSFAEGRYSPFQDLKVSFDGPGGNDRSRQGIRGKVTFTVKLAAEE